MSDVDRFMEVFRQPHILEQWAEWEIKPDHVVDPEVQQYLKDLAIKILEENK